MNQRMLTVKVKKQNQFFSENFRSICECEFCAAALTLTYDHKKFLHLGHVLAACLLHITVSVGREREPLRVHFKGGDCAEPDDLL